MRRSLTTPTATATKSAIARHPPGSRESRRGRVPPDKLDEYRQYVAETGLSDYTNTLGNRGAYILTAQREGYGDVTTLSFWESRDANARFAGEPIDRARYYPHDEQYSLEFPENVEHFDLTF